MEHLWLEALCMRSLARVATVCQTWNQEALRVSNARRKKAILIIQSAIRCALAKIRITRLRRDRMVFLMHRDGNDPDVHWLRLWRAYHACNFGDNDYGLDIQWAIEKLTSHGMPMAGGPRSGRGVLSGWYFACQLNMEQLKCLGY